MEKASYNIRQVGESVSPVETVHIWECGNCGRRWTAGDRADSCPYCSQATSRLPEPGRELDTLIADKVLGWPKTKALHAAYHTTDADASGAPLPPLSRNIDAAWHVVESLAATHIFLVIRLRPDHRYECAAVDQDGRPSRWGWMTW